MKTCQEIYNEKWKEIISRRNAHRDSIFIVKEPSDTDLKLDSIMEFLDQPELLSPIYLYNPLVSYCDCYNNFKPGMAVSVKDDMKTCSKCNKPMRELK